MTIPVAADLLIIAEPDVVAGGGEGVPRDVEPAATGEQLVGVRVGTEDVDQALELGGILRTDVGCHALEVLRTGDTTNEAVDLGIAIAGGDDDGTYLEAGGLEQEMAAEGEIDQMLGLREVGGVLGEVQKLGKKEVK